MSNIERKMLSEALRCVQADIESWPKIYGVDSLGDKVLDVIRYCKAGKFGKATICVKSLHDILWALYESLRRSVDVIQRMAMIYDPTNNLAAQVAEIGYGLSEFFMDEPANVLQTLSLHIYGKSEAGAVRAAGDLQAIIDSGSPSKKAALDAIADAMKLLPDKL